ncbi:MAG: hypothetical protein Sv326_0242 [Candidatus Fermentimicrarchaeum limneticum]|uniref:DUF2513 domain-containing protein n=1 Tax=Fermentimicrarchaeum limneticum TaxID=2795018 RepID=A0A7D6B9N3_FERL1|nr:MAG: hypothetical protein Sv326_0242 [Candidatus Fermentimicrarchaeum limneticum]
MDEIRTRIDDVFDFIQKKGKTTSREVHKGVKISGDEVDKYVYVLRKYGLIKVSYGWFDTHLYINEDPAIRLADEFKSQLYADADNTAIFDKEFAGDIANKDIKALAFMSMLLTTD